MTVVTLGAKPGTLLYPVPARMSLGLDKHPGDLGSITCCGRVENKGVSKLIGCSIFLCLIFGEGTNPYGQTVPGVLE